MTILIIILFGGVALMAGLPWIVEAIFRRRIGVWVGIIEVLSVASLIPYWFYEWGSECDPPKIEDLGNAIVDNDAACRALLLGAPIYFPFVAVCLMFLVPSVFTLFLESRRKQVGKKS
jgi:hypothetical protein